MLIKRIIAGLVLVVLVAFILSIQPRGITGYSTYNETVGNDTPPILEPLAGACTDLSNSSTWAGKLYNVSNNSFIIQDNVTLCTATFYTNTTFPLFIFNGSFTLDCNDSTFIGGGLGAAVLSTKNGSKVQNCVFQNFGLGANVLSTNAAASPLDVWNWTQDPAPGIADSINALAVDQEGYYVAVGRDRVNGGGEIGWRVVKIDRNGNTLWNYSNNFSANSGQATAVAVDQDGNYIVAGHENSTGNFGWRVEKFAPNGSIIWNWTQNPSGGIDQAFGIAVDMDGNYVAVGIDRVTGNAEMRAVKIDSAGNTIWNWTQNPTGGTDRIYAIAVDQQNNYIAAGADSTGGTEWRVVKIDSSGNTIWNWTQDFLVGGDEALAIAVDHEGDYLIGGVARGGGGDYEWQAVKLARNSSMLWNFTQNATNSDDTITGVAVDQENNYFLGGYDQAGGIPEWRAVKLNSSGSVLWNWTQRPSVGSEQPAAVAVDQDGYYLIGGRDDIPGFFQSEWRVVKLTEPRVQMSGVVFENVSFYKTNKSTYVALPNASANLTNFTIGYSTLAGKIVYSRLVNVSGTLATTWNLLLNSSFVSLNSSNTLASAFNASANITVSGASKYGFNVFKLNGFPQSRNAILATGSNVGTYTTVTGLRATFPTFNAFSGYAVNARPKPATPGGGGSSSGGASSSTSTSTTTTQQTTQQETVKTPTKAPEPAPQPEAPKKVHVEQPSKVTMSPPEPVSAPVKYVPPVKQTDNSEGILKATFYLLCIGALILLAFMAYWHHKKAKK